MLRASVGGVIKKKPTHCAELFFTIQTLAGGGGGVLLSCTLHSVTINTAASFSSVKFFIDMLEINSANSYTEQNKRVTDRTRFHLYVSVSNLS